MKLKAEDAERYGIDNTQTMICGGQAFSDPGQVILLFLMGGAAILCEVGPCL